MKSKWVEIRDSIVEALKIEEVGKSLKDEFVGWLAEEGIEFLQSGADEIIAECKKDVPNETGWCRIRDAFVVPLAINGGMYVLRLVIDKSKAEA